jgi:hypothetical protein
VDAIFSSFHVADELIMEIEACHGKDERWGSFCLGMEIAVGIVARSDKVWD